MSGVEALKIVLWQREICEGAPRTCAGELASAVARAEEAGADCLICRSVESPDAACIVPCNGSTLDIDGQRAVLKTQAGEYSVSLGESAVACDFAVRPIEGAWTSDAGVRAVLAAGMPTVAIGSVGIRNAGHAVRCYDGGSAVFDAEGNAICTLRDDFEEEFALVSFEHSGPQAEPCSNKTLAALTSAIRRFDKQVLGGSLKWVIGLSGGLDSSTVAALLVHALGSERVVGYSLPTGFNSAATRDNAAREAERLGIRYRIAPIEQVVAATEETAIGCGYTEADVSGLVHENIQARIRGHMLCTFAAIEGGVVVNNGNFVEAALGYATMYGDAIGALAPIGDLCKTDLFDLAAALNESFGTAAIPENLLPVVTEDGYEWETMPSAELASGQKDPMKWFYHDWLVRTLAGNAEEASLEVLRGYAEDRLARAGMERWIRFYGLDDPKAFIADLEWVMRQMRTAVYKRIQSVPTVLVRSQEPPFGVSEVQHPWEPSEAYEELKRALLGSRA